MNIFELLGEIKVYFTQTGTYISVINFVMLMATVKQVYNINISAFILVPLGLMGMIILGYIDYKIISPHFIKHVNKKNDVKHQLNRIEKLLKNE